MHPTGDSASLNAAAASAGPEIARPPSRAEALEATWRAYYQSAAEAPRHPAARDFLHRDLTEALARLIPVDASVLEVGCGEGDLLAALPNARRQGIDYLPETIGRARARHPEIAFEVGDAIAPPGDLVPRADAVVCDRLCHSVLDVNGKVLWASGHTDPTGVIVDEKNAPIAGELWWSPGCGSRWRSSATGPSRLVR